MLYFSIQNRLQDRTSKVSEAAGAWRIILGLSSDGRRIVFLLAEAIQRFAAEILNSEFRGRRSIWWVWRVTLLAPRIGNDVSYVMRINHEIHFAWQAQYLVKLEGDSCCSAHCKWRFICEADQWWDSFCVAGAVFGEVGVCLFVAGAAFRDILGDSRSAKCCIFQYKIVSKIGRVRSLKRRVRDDDFMLWSCSDYPRILFILAEAIQRFCAEILHSEFRGRRSTWWVWRMTLLAPRIGNDVSYVTRINHEIHFAWQAQYLVKLEGDSCCSAHCKWRFICEADQWWDSFCVAGALFGEVGVWLFVAGAAFRDIVVQSSTGVVLCSTE